MWRDENDSNTLRVDTLKTFLRSFLILCVSCIIQTVFIALMLPDITKEPFSLPPLLKES